MNVNKASRRAVWLAAAIGVAAPSVASAADWSAAFISTNRVDYIDNFANDEVNAAVREDDVRMSTSNNLIGTGRFENNVFVRIGGRLSYFQHIDRTDQDNLSVGGFADVAKRFGNGILVRAGYAAEYRRKNGENQYIQNAVDGLLSYTPSRSYRLGLSTRLGYRDFDDAFFVGLDQTRVDVRGFGFWYPFQDASNLFLETGYQRVNADNNAQSTSLYFVGFRANYAVSKKTSVGLRTKYSYKEFDVAREDKVLQVFGRVDYDFSRNVRGFAEAGVVDQVSTVATQDFTGPRVGVGVRLLFNTAR